MESKIPETEIATAAPAVEKKWIVNCPKCSTALYVKVGNYAHLCPVCSNVFRTRLGERLEKDVTRKSMVEAYVAVDKDYKGGVNTGSVVKNLED